MDSGEPILSAAEEGLPNKLNISVRQGVRGRDDGSIVSLRPVLPEFAASCMIALQTVEECSRQEFSSSAQSILCTQIIKQLWKSVDDFATAIVDQAKKRIATSETIAQASISELDESIGSIVAAETASVGAMRKSMFAAISSLFSSEPSNDAPTMQISMRYGVDLKDDGPTSGV